MDAPDVTRGSDARVRELLAPLERVPAVELQTARPKSRGLRAALAAVAAIVATSVAGLWFASGTSVTEEALAAVGSGRYLHVVVEQPVPYATVVNLRTSAERPVLRRLDVRFDEQTGLMSFTTLVDGELSSQVSGTPDPALRRFVSGFRDALEDGTAQALGRADVLGRTVQLLAISADGRSEQVALDPETHRPLAVRFGDGPWARVVTIESSAEAPAGEPPANVESAIHGNAEPAGAVDAADASRALGATALWAGPEIGGLRLGPMLLERLETTVLPGGEVRAGVGLRMQYGSQDDWIELSESPTWHAAYDFYGPEIAADGTLPPVEEMLLSCTACGGDKAPSHRPYWTGQLRSQGLYVRIRGTKRERVVLTAAALSSIPSR